MHLAASLHRKRFSEYDDLKSRLEELMTTTATSGAHVSKVEAIINILNRDHDEQNKTKPITTVSTVYKETAFPWYQLWGKLV